MKRYVRAATLSFERGEGLGLNAPVLKLSNGDEVKLTMSASDRGYDTKNLDVAEDVDEHFVESFDLYGVGGKKYKVTREVTIYNKQAKVKGGRFKSKIVKVEEI